MKRFSLLAAVLALVITGLFANLLRPLPPAASLEWRTPPVLRVSNHLRKELRGLGQKARLNYWVSKPEALPSHLRGLEEDVVRILRELERHSEGRLQVRIQHPSEHPEAASLLAARGLRPFRTRRLIEDRHIEQSAWSSLRIESGAHEGLNLQPLLPEQLPELAELVVRELKRIDEGAEAKPSALAIVARTQTPSQDGPSALEDVLASHGISATRFDSAAEVPSGFDSLWLLGSRDATAEIALVQAFLDSGRDVLIAMDEDSPSKSTSELLAAFGTYVEEGALQSEGSPALQSIAPHQDFRSYLLQPNGTLVFGPSRSVLFSGERLSELHRSLQPLAWTGPATQLHFEDGTVRPAPRRPLLSLLDPRDGREGRLVIAASTAIFSKERLRAEDPAHRSLVRLLAQPAAGRLALSRIRAQRIARLPALSVAQRSFWRSLCVFAGPALLVMVALWRGRRAWTRRAIRGGTSPSGRTGRLALSAFALALLSAGVLGSAFASFAPRAWRIDTTRAEAHRVSEAERAFLSSCLEELARRDEKLALEIVASPASQLPASLRARLRDATDLLADWGSVDSNPSAWRATTIDPDRDWTESQRDEARALGPLSRERAVSSADGRAQSLTVSELWCGLILHSGPHATAVSLLEEGGSLRFRLAFALWRLSQQERVDVAFAADRSLLSSAEALLDYSERGLFAPSGGDTTHTVRTAITAAGFDLREIDTQEDSSQLAAACEDADVLCWLQPRREIGPLLQVTANHLAEGGRALIFAQHYEIEARQLGRDALQVQFWPRPLKSDLERYYFPALGIDLVRELYFDSDNVALPLPTRVEVSSGLGQARENQLGDQPFMVRAAAAGLGDLALPSVSRIQFESALADVYDIAMKPILYGSRHWWSYDWSGGNLPPEALADRSLDLDSNAAGDRQVLAAQFEGRFPRAVRSEREWTAAAEAGPAEGRLILTGNSAFLRDSLLATRAGTHGSEFLIDCLARLALPPALADLNHRRDVPAPLEPLPSSTRMRARILVLGLGPLLLLLFAGLRALFSAKAL